MDDFVASVVFIFFLVFFSIGFSFGPMYEEKAYPDELQQAGEICEANMGLKYLELDLLAHDVYCNNGAVFRDAVEGGRKQ